MDASPVFELSEHVFDSVTLFVEDDVFVGVSGLLRLDFEGMQAARFFLRSASALPGTNRRRNPCRRATRLALGEERGQHWSAAPFGKSLHLGPFRSSSHDEGAGQRRRRLRACLGSSGRFFWFAPVYVEVGPF